jgi:hypothetical protein
MLPPERSDFSQKHGEMRQNKNSNAFIMHTHKKSNCASNGPLGGHMWGFSICLLELYTIVCERTRAKAIPVKEAEGKNNNLQTPACVLRG